LSNPISEKDKIDWQNFISNKEKLPDKDKKYQKKIFRKIKTLDLHGLSLDKANKIIDEFINESYNEKIEKLIIVTGKGIHSNNEKNPFISKDLGILKYSVPEYIENNKDLMKKIKEIKNANLKDGGSGAFYIYLKKK